MKKTIRKLKKGLIGIFLIKLTIVGLLFLSQSCQPENDDFLIKTQKDALNNFELVMSKAIPQIERINKIYSPADNNLINLNKKNSSFKEETTTIVAPLITESINLLNAFEFTENDISEVLDETDSIMLIAFGMAILQSELNHNNFDNKTGINNKIFPLFQSIQAQNWSKISRCAKKAFGLDDIGKFREWHKMSKSSQKKLLRKLAGKLASRYASSYIGIIIIIGEFSLCMY